MSFTKSPRFAGAFLGLVLVLAASAARTAGPVRTEWERSFNASGAFGDNADAITSDPAGNVIIAGHSYVDGSGTDHMTLKYSPSGDLLWSRGYNTGGNSDETGRGVGTDAEGNVYVSGYSNGSTIYTLKYDPDGNELWTATYNDPTGLSSTVNAMAVDPDGNTYVVGTLSNENSLYLTVKYDSAGVEQWARTFSSPTGDSEAYGVAIDAAGAAYVTGRSLSTGLGDDAVTIKYSAAGDELWTARYSAGATDERALKVAVAPDGNIFVGGDTNGSGSGNQDYLVIKYDPLGSEVWAVAYNGTGAAGESFSQLATTSESGVIVAGNSHSPTGGGWGTVKFDSQGDLVWQAHFPAFGSPIAMAVDPSDNAYVVGTNASSLNATKNYAALMFAPDGSQVWSTQYSGFGANHDVPADVCVTGDGGVYVTGISYRGPGTGNDITTFKYRTDFAPVAQAQALGTDEDTPLSVSLSATDNEGSPLIYQVVFQPQHGTLSGTPPNLTYSPSANYSGSDFFRFRASDGNAFSASATIDVAVAPVNDAPTANPLSTSTPEDTAKSLTLSGADADGDSLSYEVVADPEHGVLSGTPPNVTYTPTADYFGEDSFSFRVSDGTLTSNPATVSLLIAPAPDAPEARDDGYTVNEDVMLTVPAAGILSNDGDVDGNPLTAMELTAPTHGTLALQTSGALTYMPTANYHGTDSFTYRASDGTLMSSPATVSIQINAVNDAPTATALAVSTNEDTARPIALAGADTEGDPLTYTVLSGPSHGELSGGAPNVTYNPATNYHGPDSITFRVNDGTANSAPATISITVNPINDAPTASAQSVSTNEDTLAAITLAGVDAEGSALSYTVLTNPIHGALAGTAPNLTYTPSAHFHGPDNFTFRVNDGTANSAAATVSIVVNSVNDTPAATGQALDTNEDTPKSIALVGADADGDTLNYAVLNGPSHGTLSGTAPNPTYTPAAHYHGPDNFMFRVNDGTVDSAPATIALTVASVNDLPTATGQAISTNEDTAASITLGGADADNDALTYTVLVDPAHGALSGTAPNLTYTPVTNYHGSDSFTFRVSDGTANSEMATVNVTVNSINDPPTATAQSVSINEDTSKAVTLMGSDVDADPLTYTVLEAPAHGSLDGTAPNLTYTPVANYYGTDTFTFRANDGTANSASATVSITVSALNDLPIPTAQEISTNEDTPKAILLAGSDPDAEPLTFTVNDGPAHGVLSGTAPSLTYTPATNYHGPDSFTFRVTDSTATSEPATVSITVNAVNDAPLSVADSYSTPRASQLVVAAPGVLANDSDVEGSLLQAGFATTPTGGTLVLNPDGSLRYTPAVGFTGIDEFTYRASDGTLQGVPATVRITVGDTPPASTPGKVSGNGRLGTGSAKASFSLKASMDRRGRVVGQLTYRSETGVQVKSTSLTGVVVNGTRARIYGRAKIKNLRDLYFVAEVFDGGKPGAGKDEFSLEVHGGPSVGVTKLASGNLLIKP